MKLGCTARCKSKLPLCSVTIRSWFCCLFVFLKRLVNSETLDLVVKLRCTYTYVRVRKMFLKMEGFLMGLEQEKFHLAQNRTQKIIKHVLDRWWAVDAELLQKQAPLLLLSLHALRCSSSKNSAALVLTYSPSAFHYRNTLKVEAEVFLTKYTRYAYFLGNGVFSWIPVIPIFSKDGF